VQQVNFDAFKLGLLLI